MRKIGIRTISGAVFVAIMLSVIYFGAATFAIWILFVMCVALWEFYNIARKLSVCPQRSVGFTIAVILYATGYMHAFDVLPDKITVTILYLIIPLAVWVFIRELYRRCEQPFVNIAYTFLGVIYVALPFSLMPIVFAEMGQAFVFCYFILLWTNDTFAYLFGITLGKHRLFPRHSPKKSWEGYIGGIASVSLSSYLLHLVFPELAIIHIVVTGLIIAITSTLGDLVESMLKRNAGIKDAGKIMPGHGGLMDRFDVTFLSLPLVFLYIKILQAFAF
jgi:phosphatidate cytidylyltransferase